MPLPPETGSSAAIAAAVSETRLSRRRCRHKLMSVAYVNIDHANGGIMRDLSETGAALQAVGVLKAGQQVHLRFELLQPRLRMETTARVCWAGLNGQAGVEFAPLPPRQRRLLQDWLFTQLLFRAEAAFGESSIFRHQRENHPLRHHPIAESESREATTSADVDSISADPGMVAIGLSWFRSQRALASVVDGLILLAALLLFAVIAIAMMHGVPQWPLSAAVACAATIVFAGSYWFLSVAWIGITPGVYLLRAALGEYEADPDALREERDRFR